MAEIVQRRSVAARLPLVRLEHLWVLFALSIIGVFISMVPTSPNDFWWHLKAGALIANGDFPRTNMFAWTIPADTPYVYQSWLAEWLYYVVYASGGFPLVIFARNMLGLGAFMLVAYEAHRRSGSWRLAAGVTLLAAAMSINNLTARTQNWSWIPFMLFLILLGSYADQRLRPRWLIALPLLMIVWVNLHGAFMMGLLVTGAFVAGETLRRLLRQSRALTWEKLRLLYAVFAAMIVATVVNPLGIGIFGYVRLLLEDPASQQMIIEWQPPTPRSLAGFFFYGSVLGLLAAMSFARRRPTITDVLLLCGLGWMAFNGVRYVIWFGMVAMPIMAQSLAAPRAVFTPANTATAPVSRREQGGGTVANLIVALMLVGAVVIMQPWIKPTLPLPQPYQMLFVAMPGAPQLFTVDTPVDATEHLREQPCQGKLFNEMGYGSYLDWALYPQTQIFIDPRVELYPLELWHDYINLSRGRDVEMLLDQYDIACVMLDRRHQPDLAEAMVTLPGWRQSFATDQSEVWRRERS